MDWIKVKAQHLSINYSNAQIGALIRYHMFYAQNNREPTDREMSILIGKKDLANAKETMSNLGVTLDQLRSKVDEDRESIELKREQGKARQGKYRAKKNSNALRDGNVTKQIRLDKIREDKSIEKKPQNSISYLKEIPEEDMKIFTDRFDVTSSKVKDKAESLHLYCKSKGRVYKNYKAFLLTAMKKDFTLRVKRVVKQQEKEVEQTPEQKAKIKAQMDAISKSMRI